MTTHEQELAFANSVADEMIPLDCAREDLVWTCLCGIQEAEDNVSEYDHYAMRAAYRRGRDWREKMKGKVK